MDDIHEYDINEYDNNESGSEIDNNESGSEIDNNESGSEIDNNESGSEIDENKIATKITTKTTIKTTTKTNNEDDDSIHGSEVDNGSVCVVGLPEISNAVESADYYCTASPYGSCPCGLEAPKLRRTKAGRRGLRFGRREFRSANGLEEGSKGSDGLAEGSKGLEDLDYSEGLEEGLEGLEDIISMIGMLTPLLTPLLSSYTDESSFNQISCPAKELVSQFNKMWDGLDQMGNKKIRAICFMDRLNKFHQNLWKYAATNASDDKENTFNATALSLTAEKMKGEIDNVMKQLSK